MTFPKDDKNTASQPSDCKAGDPDWTTGLKRLYDGVLDEPLPDSFKDLLSQLDGKEVS